MSSNNYYGIYQGVVTDIKDPEKRGRLKVICPEVLGGDAESAWCDPVVPVAYDRGGDFCIPEVEEMVWIMFIAGDVNRPVWVGGWWSESLTPLGNSYSNVDKVRIISYSDCTITLKNGTIDINVGEGDFNLRIKDGKVKVKGNLEVEGNLEVNGKVSVNSDALVGGNLSVDNTTTLNKTTLGNTTLKGNLDVGGNVSIDGKVEVNGNVSVDGNINADNYITNNK